MQFSLLVAHLVLIGEYELSLNIHIVLHSILVLVRVVGDILYHFFNNNHISMSKKKSSKVKVLINQYKADPDVTI